MDEARAERVKTAFAAALMHPVEEVRSFTTRAIDETVWAVDRALALRCANAIAAEAAIIDKALEAEDARSYGERREVREIMADAATRVCALFWEDGGVAEAAHATLDTSERIGAHTLKRLLMILGRVPQDQLAIAAFKRASQTLAGWWTSGDDRSGRHSRDFHTESAVSQRIQDFLLRTSPEVAREVLAPLLALIDDHSRDLHSVLEGLTGRQDRNPNTPQYWFLWSLFADAAKRAKWIPLLDEARHPDGLELLSAIFLTMDWVENVRHWSFLDGYADLVHGLFEALPPTSSVLDSYTRFLYEIGERSLPGAFVRVAAALKKGNAQRMLTKSKTVFMLDVRLQRYVYGRPLELKREPPLRGAVLFILDCLVEAGSSAAFRMRDDFVTPVA